jgi:hypothetical protein
MSPNRKIAWAVLLAGAALLFALAFHRRASPPNVADPVFARSNETQPDPARSPRRTAAGSLASETAGVEETVAPDATTTTSHVAPLDPPRLVPVPESAESSSLPAATVLENMRTSLRQYLSVFGENPVGNNSEITSALEGENSRHISFLKQDGNRVNSNGELVDVWGTPYFFHQLSAHEMEIRSAGPDHVMYTGDDLVTR